MTVNHDVTGSSPVRGAKQKTTPIAAWFFLFLSLYAGSNIKLAWYSSSQCELLEHQFGEPTESRSNDLLFYMFMRLEDKWHQLNTHCSLRERLLICYSAVGHAEWRNVAWCHWGKNRFRFLSSSPTNSQSTSLGSHMDLRIGVSCFYMFEHYVTNSVACYRR